MNFLYDSSWCWQQVFLFQLCTQPPFYCPSTLTKLIYWEELRLRRQNREYETRWVVLVCCIKRQIISPFWYNCFNFAYCFNISYIEYEIVPDKIVTRTLCHEWQIDVIQITFEPLSVKKEAIFDTYTICICRSMQNLYYLSLWVGFEWNDPLMSYPYWLDGSCQSSIPVRRKIKSYLW